MPEPVKRIRRENGTSIDTCLLLKLLEDELETGSFLASSGPTTAFKGPIAKPCCEDNLYSSQRDIENVNGSS